MLRKRLPARTSVEPITNRVTLAKVSIAGIMNGCGKKSATFRSGSSPIGDISQNSGASRPFDDTKGRTSGRGGIASGWKSNACNINGKKCAAASGGNISATSRQCAGCRTKTSENGATVSGWKNSVTNMKCGKSRSSSCHYFWLPANVATSTNFD